MVTLNVAVGEGTWFAEVVGAVLAPRRRLRAAESWRAIDQSEASRERWSLSDEDESDCPNYLAFPFQGKMPQERLPKSGRSGHKSELKSFFNKFLYNTYIFYMYINIYHIFIQYIYLLYIYNNNITYTVLYWKIWEVRNYKIIHALNAVRQKWKEKIAKLMKNPTKSTKNG